MDNGNILIYQNEKGDTKMMHFSMTLQYGCHKEVLQNYIKRLLKVL